MTEPSARDPNLPAPGASGADLVLALCLDQRRRWQRGERVRAEDYLEAHPALASDPERAVDLVYNEFLLREELGESPQAEEYLRRFPDYRALLERQLAIHGSLAGSSQESARPTEPATAPEAPPAGGLPTAAAWPLVEGYEILGELGRGGMGVVYKARQRGLERLVALKMIRDDALSGPAERTRFTLEAVAAARLHHANIVEVYQLGEQDGRPFLSLEFCAGGTLAQQLDGTPRSPAAAAALVKVLARAVDAAHQQGVVHRDLKPANVLLAADGTPKVGDFGLAKYLGGEGGQTRTGAVLGTPCYMAPEQAEGRSKEVGPATDVYALGAILYEYLTGRPPFWGETVLETLQLVRTQEPVPPRRLVPAVPRDLETITLTCLHKEPPRRYPTAAALADDLDRFLRGEPVQARRMSLGERLGRWCRRPERMRDAGILTIFLGIGLLLWSLYNLVVLALGVQVPQRPGEALATLTADCAAFLAFLWIGRGALRGQLAALWAGQLTTLAILGFTVACLLGLPFDAGGWLTDPLVRAPTFGLFSALAGIGALSYAVALAAWYGGRAAARPASAETTTLARG